jgi:wobble nucleotide-excising tRNase
MLHKIEKLISIGKFRNYQATGAVHFDKLTTIYGDNGGGKTTLTAILRSLTNNNSEIIKSRISTNHSNPQAAQISCKDATGTKTFYTYGTAGWSVTLPDVEIFDIHFVNDNIYSGFDFNDDHKKQLHQFVVGSQGVAIQQQIEKNKADKAASRLKINDLETQIIAQVGNRLSTSLLTSFLNFTPNSAVNIDAKISTANAALATAHSNTTIRSLPRLVQIPLVLTDEFFAEIIASQATTTQTVQDAALKTIFETKCQHLVDNGMARAEPWLKYGFQVVEKLLVAAPDDLFCPFCDQIITQDFDLIKAYAAIFDAEFNSLVTKIESHVESVSKINIELLLQNLENPLSTNSNSITAWQTHLPTTVRPPVNNIILDKLVFQNAYEQCLLSIKKKSQNPSVAVASTLIVAFSELVKSANSRIRTYNTAVQNYNLGIATFLGSIQTTDLAQLEVDKYKRIKQRFEPAIVTLCATLATEKQALATLTAAYPSLVSQQNTAVSAFFGLYQTKINYYLRTVFRTHFQIDSITHIAPQGKAVQSKIGYKLVIDGQDISFEPNQPFSVKECLSEGDKTTIALAFFLSKLDIDPNKADKILVFDDPLSSLDSNRRNHTVGIIKLLRNDMKQVIVLSHNEHFLHAICNKEPRSEVRNLRITENYAAKASIVEECNLNELVKIDYFRHLEELEQFRVNPDPAKQEYILGLLRNVLEAHITFKFYRDIRSIGGDKTFGVLISQIESQNIVFKNDTNRLTIINNLKTINSVSWRPHHGIPTPNTTVGTNPNALTAPELDAFIQDTLDLIDNQL